jgi:hypothetical protein
LGLRHTATSPQGERFPRYLLEAAPPPWTVEELDNSFVAIDSAEQKLAYVYFEEESGRRLSL